MKQVNYVRDSKNNENTSRVFFAPNIRIPTPRILRLEDKPPQGEATTIEALCKKAGLTYKASGGFPPVVFLIRNSNRGLNNEHLMTEKDGRKIYFINLDLLPARHSNPAKIDAEQAVRILETAAYGFHDYFARECVRGIFTAPLPKAPASVWE